MARNTRDRVVSVIKICLQLQNECQRIGKKGEISRFYEIAYSTVDGLQADSILFNLDNLWWIESSMRNKEAIK